MTIFTVPTSMDRRKKTWRKHLTSVDTSQKSGYAFIGSWLRVGEKAEAPVGSYVMGYDEPGSVKNWYPVIRLWQVSDNDEDLTEVFEYEGGGCERNWALAVRDEIAGIVNKNEPDNPLAHFSIEELQAEIERRQTDGN
jgi:hypothetical protein